MSKTGGSGKVLTTSHKTTLSREESISPTRGYGERSTPSTSRKKNQSSTSAPFVSTSRPVSAVQAKDGSDTILSANSLATTAGTKKRLPSDARLNLPFYTAIPNGALQPPHSTTSISTVIPTYPDTIIISSIKENLIAELLKIQQPQKRRGVLEKDDRNILGGRETFSSGKRSHKPMDKLAIAVEGGANKLK